MHPLHETIPAEVRGYAAAPLHGYRSYATFSVPWFLRRSMIFMPAAAGVGLLEALILGIEFDDAHLGLLCGAVSIPVWIIIVTAGPALATLARSAGRAPALERPAVIIAVALGVAASFTAQHWANDVSGAYVLSRYQSVFPGFDPFKWKATLIRLTWVIRGAQLLIFVSLGGGPALITYFRELSWWRRAEHAREIAVLNQQREEAHLKLMVLQAQVEPHFLFNTLASVHSLIRQDPARAEATLEALVDHLRATLPKLRADVGSIHSTLAEQIELCRSYLAVMQVRMGSRLRYAIDVPPTLGEHPFPPLMLITLVENAIKHGIEPSPGGGQITLTAATETGAEVRQLTVSVIDSGTGLRTGAAGGMGLDNIRAQLIARFGARGALVIQGRTVGGTMASVRVPYEAAA